MKKKLNVLVLAPHVDDGEIGAGGLINKLIEDGNEVYYVAFSICEESVPKDYPIDIMASEVLKATKELGIKNEKIFVFRYKVRMFSENRQDILEKMIELRTEINPDIVLLPSKFDCHQDHRVIFDEGVRAYRDSTLLCYEMPWNNAEFETNMFVELEERHINAKVRAFEKYRSQSSKRLAPKDLKTLAQARGLHINAKYVEVYNVFRWIWK